MVVKKNDWLFKYVGEYNGADKMMANNSALNEEVYLYDQKIDHSENDIKTNVAILIAADELCDKDLCTSIENYLLDNKKLLERCFVLIQNVASQFTQFNKLVRFCKIVIKRDPSIIFKADDFTEIKQEILLDILVKDKHSVKTNDIWDNLMKWSIAQSDELPSDITKWTQNDVSTFGTIIQPFIPYIRFENISTIDFVRKWKRVWDGIWRWES
ncbi:8568_t:CDS:2 [Funneliformis mosseae]|uniref:8568_t:CDS:1 n=1 Tax=Funneliformis mosseae TaxID=27381 RepID=A0A9N8VYM0_FUNMO|nr:8568_t:CDS:2 [Funneliformis mosseae]